MKYKKPENRDNADWDAISDARSLVQAEMIKADETRYKNAIAWAKLLLENEEKSEIKAFESLVADA